MLFIQITSGNGPMEASLATKIVYEDIVSKNNLKITNINTFMNEKSVDNNPRSIIIEVDDSDKETDDYNTLSMLIKSGTWRVSFKSPYRHTMRKNWFVRVNSIFVDDNVTHHKIDNSKFEFSTFHCGGHGGQNVNKVETGVRLTYIPLNITVTSTEQRTQYLNRKEAIRKLQEKLTKTQYEELEKFENDLWKSNYEIERGNEVRSIIVDNIKKYKDMEVK